MFRPMRRIKQQIPEEECIKILKEEPRGVLSVLGDDGYPYGVPIDHYYDEKTGRIYFHCAKEGHKLDAIRRCDKVVQTLGAVIALGKPAAQVDALDNPHFFQHK